ncbi:MAG: GntR family transcriptional regulator [Balneolaceae bacterium]
MSKINDMLKDGTPYHKQISDWLRKQIEKNLFLPNEKLPSESDLSEKFNVSRVTVRRALQTLENEQVIYRCQGIGSFVSDQRSHQSFATLNDFMEEMAGSGLNVSSKLISFSQTDADERVEAILSLKNLKKVVKIERVRLGNGEPVAFDITWMPLFYGQLLEGHDLEESTIFKILESEYEIPILKGCYRIDAALSDESLAEHLSIETGIPLVLIERISYTISDKPIYYQKRYYRRDKVAFEVRTERNHTLTGDSNEKGISVEINTSIRANEDYTMGQ